MSKVLLLPTKYGRRFKRVDLATFNAAKAGSNITIDGVEYTTLVVKVWNHSLVQVKSWAVKPATQPVTNPVVPDPNNPPPSPPPDPSVSDEAVDTPVDEVETVTEGHTTSEAPAKPLATKTRKAA
jgi:hypothetical protein